MLSRSLWKTGLSILESGECTFPCGLYSMPDHVRVLLGHSLSSGCSPFPSWLASFRSRTSVNSGQDWWVVVTSRGASSKFEATSPRAENISWSSFLARRDHPVIRANSSRITTCHPHSPHTAPHCQKGAYDTNALSSARPNPHALLQIFDSQRAGVFLRRHGGCADTLNQYQEHDLG